MFHTTQFVPNIILTENTWLTGLERTVSKEWAEDCQGMDYSFWTVVAISTGLETEIVS